MTSRRQALGERGGATLLVLFAALFLLAVGATATVWATVSLAHHRATAAADLAALSAAQAIQSGIPDPCSAAIRAASSQQATLTRCTPEGEAVSVDVFIPLPLGALGSPTITTTARAGPTTEAPPSSTPQTGLVTNPNPDLRPVFLAPEGASQPAPASKPDTPTESPSDTTGAGPHPGLTPGAGAPAPAADTDEAQHRDDGVGGERVPGGTDVPTRPLLVVDAANVIGSRPDGWWRDRPGAARRLLTSLTAYLDGPGAHTDITVVLEGAAKAATDQPVADPPPPALQVVLAKASGDDTIVEVVATALQQHPDRPTTVVTADRGLRSRVEPLGATTTGPNHLWSLLD